MYTIPNFPALVDIAEIKWYNKLFKYDHSYASDILLRNLIPESKVMPMKTNKLTSFRLVWLMAVAALLLLSAICFAGCNEVPDTPGTDTRPVTNPIVTDSEGNAVTNEEGNVVT